MSKPLPTSRKTRALRLSNSSVELPDGPLMRDDRVVSGHWTTLESPLLRDPVAAAEQKTAGCSWKSIPPVIDWTKWQHEARIVFSGNDRAVKAEFLPSQALISLPELIPNRADDPLLSALVSTLDPW